MPPVNQPPGESAIARAFGAEVRTELSGAGTFLVVGQAASPAGLVRGAGGQVLVAFDDRRLLAVLPVQAGLGLQRHPAIALCGPVSVDLPRLLAMLGQAPLQAAGSQPEG
jgi:hypothetical protein